MRGTPLFTPELQNTISAFTREYGVISQDRKAALGRIAAYVQKQVDQHAPANLIFICTHNSRRSHMSQILAQTAAAHYKVPGVQTYSGGTEATAFNPNAVKALTKVGYDIAKTTETDNPVYHVRFGKDGPAMPAFSKIYSEAPNPSEHFCAVMTCSHVDEVCPVVPGATTRVSIPYEDPKAADHTPQEASVYEERARQIGREMFYLFSLVKAPELKEATQ